MSTRSRGFYSFLNAIITNFTIPVHKTAPFDKPLPSYRKKYYWGEKHCNELFDNIVMAGENAEKRTHFIGSIVYSFNEEDEASECVIIDGQQRVITIILIYIALYKFAKKMNSKSQEQYIPPAYNSFLNKKLIRNIVNLEPKEIYQEIFKHITINDEVDFTDRINFADESNINESLKLFARMVKNFECFSKRIDENNFKIIKKGLEKLIFIEINLEKKYVEYYQKLLYFTNDGDEDIKPFLWYNVKLGIKYAYPFLAKIYYDFDTQFIDKATFIAVMSTVQTFLWRRIIANYPVGGLSKTFMVLYDLVDKNNYLDSVQQNLLQNPFPSDSELREILKDKDIYALRSDYKIYLFEKLENYQNDGKNLLNFNKVSIGHIFPLRPAPQWQEKLGEAECEAMKKYLNTLGNLTVSIINCELGNLYFTDKQEMNRNHKKQGYKYSTLWLNSSLHKLERWDKKALEARTQELTERFLTVWNLPTVKGVNKTSTVWIFGKIKKMINKIFGK